MTSIVLPSTTGHPYIGLRHDALGDDRVQDQHASAMTHCGIEIGFGCLVVSSLSVEEDKLGDFTFLKELETVPISLLEPGQHPLTYAIRDLTTDLIFLDRLPYLGFDAPLQICQLHFGLIYADLGSLDVSLVAVVDW